MVKNLMTAFASFSLLFAALAPVKAQKYENGLIDKTVALIGKDAVMISDIESEVQMMRANGVAADINTRCEVLEGMLFAKLFLTQARLDSLTVTPSEVEENVKQRVNQIISALGGEEEAAAYFGKPLYKLRDAWSESVEEKLLTQQMQQKVYQSIPKLTPKDVKTYTDTVAQDELPIIPTQYKLSQIVLYPDKETAATKVKERLLELRERIVNGEKFSSLARLYSQDPGSAAKGGELGLMSRSVFWPVFSDAAMALKVGQVSQIVETPDGFHIIQMIEKKGDMFNARHILIKPEYTQEDRNKAFTRLDSIKTVIQDSTLAFKVAAWNFSEDFKTRTNGGVMVDEMTGSTLFDKDQLKPADYAMIKNMEPGEISEPFESVDNEGRGNTIYKILKIDEIVPAHTATFESDYSQLISAVNNANAEKAVNEFVAAKQKTTYIVVDKMYQGCNFERQGWIKEN